MTEKTALIDFCETIADFQTLDPYLQYVIGQEHPRRGRALNSALVKRGCALLTRLLRAFGWDHYLYKTLLVRQLRGMRYEQLAGYGERYYEERIKGHLIAPVLTLLAQLKAQGYRLMIVSGGSDLYISFFAREYGIDDVLSAQLGYENGVCSGKLIHECMGREKPAMLRAYMHEHDIAGEPAVAVSDSLSDLPMLDMCKRKIVISRGHHQPWVTDTMEEIIWD